MTLDFNKPIRYKDGDKAEIKILYHDDEDVLYFNPVCKGKFFIKKTEFSSNFENVLLEIKGFIGIDTVFYHTTAIYKTKKELLQDYKKLKAIIEINVNEGEALD